MLTLMTKSKVAAFVVIALVATTFLSVRYVGLDRFLGGYEVTVTMPEAGGLFKNSEVTYRGVPIGKVASLTATEDGAEAVLRIERGAPDIPAQVRARVVDRSAIGEQYLDLSGGALDGDHLGDGARLSVAAADLPPSMDGLLRSSRDFVASVPSEDLNTVIDETYEFTRGNGVHLSRLVKNSQSFAESADRNFLVTASLIDKSETVLATQQASSASIQSYAKSMSLLTHALADQDAAWRKVVDTTPAAARQLDALFSQVGQPLGQLMANMISTAQVFGTNAAGVKETMVRLPEGISITYATLTSRGMRSGSQLSFFNPLPCVDGYGGTQMRQGTDTKGGKPFNTQAGCTMPRSSGTNVRGPSAVMGSGKRTVVVDSADTLSDLMGGAE